MKDQLDNLPASDDKFWEGADVHKSEPKNLFDQKHNLIRVPGHQAQCTHCDWGFQLDPGDKIKEGHLFDSKGKLVI